MSNTDEELFQILKRKRKFTWLTYDEILKEDGYYFSSLHWNCETIDEIKTIADFHLHRYITKDGTLAK